MNYKYLIIGAGPTGLGAAYRLSELGEDSFCVLEATDRVGGLAASFVDSGGFTWDVGGHVQFSHYDYFDDAMDHVLPPSRWLSHNRSAWAWLYNKFVPYPVQCNIHEFPEALRWSCLESLLAAQKAVARPTNFEEWGRSVFGDVIAEEFFLPYNRKVWAYEPRELDFRWIGERVATVNIPDIAKKFLGKSSDESWGPNSTFRFPRSGGTGAIWKAVADSVAPERILLRSAVAGIETNRRVVITTDGREFAFETILSTAPIPTLLRALSPLPESDVLTAGDNLRFSSSHIVGLGIQGRAPESLLGRSWIYFSEPNCPFYRATVFSNYSPENVPAGSQSWSLMLETSSSLQRPLGTTDIVAATVEGCYATGLLRRSDKIISSWSYSAKFGYPTPTLNRDRSLEMVHNALEPLGIFSRGRFGGWKYEVSNQDHSFMQGVEWVNRMALRVPETTYFFPEVANGNWGRARRR